MNYKAPEISKLSGDLVLTIPKSLRSLDIADLAMRFDEHWTRIQGGRVNEMLFYEVERIFPSNYSMIVASDDLHYRYVSSISFLS